MESRVVINNGVRQKVNKCRLSGFKPDRNDPCARFSNIIAGYRSMNRPTDAIADSFDHQEYLQRQGVIEIVGNILK